MAPAGRKGSPTWQIAKAGAMQPGDMGGSMKPGASGGMGGMSMPGH